nr:hypothetical protein [Tanacetum cinerariifolium]
TNTPLLLYYAKQHPLVVAGGVAVKGRDKGGGAAVTWRINHDGGDEMVVRGVFMVVLMVWWLRCGDGSDDEDGGDEWLGDTDGKDDHGGGVGGVRRLWW